ncbi:MAG: PIN domain-containing protein [Terriglobia bacterium]
MPSVVQALCDSGLLIALFDPSEGSHERCRAALQEFRGRFVTSWPVLTEVFHFLDRPVGRALLWDFVLSDAVRVEEVLKSDLARMRVLMEQYADLPMDFADASLVALAERLRVFRVFTLDRRGFTVVRPRHAEFFEIFP